MLVEDKIETILVYGDEHPDFDTSFVESIKEKYEEYGRLTERQEEALDNIIDKFKMLEG